MIADVVPGSRLLYLGFAFPPGLAALHPEMNPAGHALETRMVAQLRRYFEIRSAGLLPVEVAPLPMANPETGIAHDLLLIEKPPELLYRLRAVARLKAAYRQWRNEGWQPEAVLVYNMSPVYNQFLLWLRRQPNCPKLVLLLLDSAHLGQPISWRKQLRRRFKPLHVPDERMLMHFDACVGLSRGVWKYFQPREVPFLWMPGGCTPERAVPVNGSEHGRLVGANVSFGYFGALGAHSGARALAELFLQQQLPASLDICGYGKFSLDGLPPANARLRFRGLLTPSDCLRFGTCCDVLVNPRPLTHGNENNFASKLFEYALTGRTILTSQMSGVEQVLGPAALYFDPGDFARSLSLRLREACGMSPLELTRRGKEIQRRVVTEFAWSKQAGRMADFIYQVCRREQVGLEVDHALAA
ncbi:MAG TPA: hypothetical protein VGW37_03300 [Terriglobia bacterium]|nr:hypothetical protein [Terriglobia bacterium]